MGRSLNNISRARVYTFALAAIFILGIFISIVGRASGAQFQNRTIALSNNLPSATASYRVSVYQPSATDVGSFKIEFCGNTALFEVTCVPPVGFDASDAVLAMQSGQTAFAIDADNSNANTIVLTRPVAGVTPGTSVYNFTSIKNPNYQGSFFARMSTYESEDASGPLTDYGSVALATTASIAVTTEVPPFLYFCVGTTVQNNDCATAEGNFVDLGVLSPQKAAYGHTQMVAATNASFGYTVRIIGRTLASGNNEIQPLQSQTISAPGNSQFGINLRANSQPPMGTEPSGPGSGTVTAGYSVPNRYRYVEGDVIANTSGPDEQRTYTANYLVNVNGSQPPGVYNSTFTYIALANF